MCAILLKGICHVFCFFVAVISLKLIWWASQKLMTWCGRSDHTDTVLYHRTKPLFQKFSAENGACCVIRFSCTLWKQLAIPVVELKMTKVKTCVVIKYLSWKGLTPPGICELRIILAVLGEDAPSYSTVKKWAADFKWDSLEDDPHPGRPAHVTTTENNYRVHDELMADPWVDIQTIAKITGIYKKHCSAHLDPICTGFLPSRSHNCWRLIKNAHDAWHPGTTCSCLGETQWNILFQVCDCGWILGPPLSTWEQISIETADAHLLRYPKNGPQCSTSGQSDGDNLGFRGCAAHRLPSEKDRLSLGTTMKPWFIICVMPSRWKGMVCSVSSGQYTSTISCADGCHPFLWHFSGYPSTILTRSHTIRLSPIPKIEKELSGVCLVLDDQSSKESDHWITIGLHVWTLEESM